MSILTIEVKRISFRFYYTKLHYPIFLVILKKSESLSFNLGDFAWVLYDRESKYQGDEPLKQLLYRKPPTCMGKAIVVQKRDTLLSKVPIDLLRYDIHQRNFALYSRERYQKIKQWSEYEPVSIITFSKLMKPQPIPELNWITNIQFDQRTELVLAN